MIEKTRRSGSQTRAEVLRVALSLFIEKGYEATSLREIGDELGISKAALYYHFASKEDIVKEGLRARGMEAAELLSWARTQEPGPELVEEVVLRWVDSTSVDKLQGIRFINANPTILRKLSAGAWVGAGAGAVAGDGAGTGVGAAAGDLGGSLTALADWITAHEADPGKKLLVRMALLSLNSAVMAAEGTLLTDDEIVAAAQGAARHLLASL